MVCTALALALFFALIREVGPQRALVITFVNPAVAVLLGVLLLDEPFTLGIALGLPLVVLGCVLATRRSTPRQALPDARGRRRRPDDAVDRPPEPTAELSAIRRACACWPTGPAAGEGSRST